MIAATASSSSTSTPVTATEKIEVAHSTGGTPTRRAASIKKLARNRSIFYRSTRNATHLGEASDKLLANVDVVKALSFPLDTKRVKKVSALQPMQDLSSQDASPGTVCSGGVSPIKRNFPRKS
jgi:hypothetical protein